MNINCNQYAYTVIGMGTVLCAHSNAFHSAADTEANMFTH